MFEAKKGKPFERGTWRTAIRDGHLVVNFCCPQCGGYGTLIGPEANHKMAKDGTITPSVQCDCGWHEMVKLVCDRRLRTLEAARFSLGVSEGRFGELRIDSGSLEGFRRGLDEKAKATN